jgi:hypothetical protein
MFAYKMKFGILICYILLQNIYNRGEEQELLFYCLSSYRINHMQLLVSVCADIAGLP